MKLIKSGSSCTWKPIVHFLKSPDHVMKVIKPCLMLTLGIHISALLFSQTDNISLGSKYDQLFDRLDIKLKNDSLFGFTKVKPYSREKITRQIEYLDSLDKAGALPVSLSNVDRYTMKHLLMENAEWTNHYRDSFQLGHHPFNAFYRTPAHLFAVNTKELILRVEPVLNLQYGHANDGTGSIYLNTRGALIRGSAFEKKLGFYTYLTDNQERDPRYVRNYVAAHDAVPGEGFYKSFKGDAYDYFDARGGIAFTAAKYLNIQFAYDKLFIGDGYRSLFLSDFSNSYLFLRLSTRLWKLDYEMVIAETIQSVPQADRQMKPKNYMALHHVSARVAPWLTLGFYENIMEDGKNGLQLSYLNPMIFYRSMEGQLGAAGKANIGLDLKSNITGSLQLYSQLLINEFHIKEVLQYNRGAWVNKQALQTGLKYIDVLGIKNLDLQLEANWIRPYTYTNFDSVTNLTHYNLPLAHPLGANVQEFIALARYQPFPKLYLSARLNYFKQGLDSAAVNMGSNVFLSYNTRPRDYGIFIGSGIPVKSLTASVNASYEIFEHLFLDVNTTCRNYNIKGQPKSNVFFYTVGLRMNMQRREFVF